MSNPNESADHATPQEPPQVTITTLPFELTPKVYFRILLRIMFLGIWWVIALVAVFALFCISLFFFNDANVRFGGFLGLVFFSTIILILILRFWFLCRNTAYHPSSKVTMKTVVMVLAKDQIVAHEPENSNVSMYLRDEIYLVEKCKNHYVIWVTHQLIHYLPKNAFSTPEDIKAFESKILPAYKELKRSLIPGFFYLIAILASTIIFGLIFTR